MKIMYAMRHGDYNFPKQELRDDGKPKIILSARRLDRNIENLDSAISREVTIYHSPLQRAQETAVIVAGELGRWNPSTIERNELDEERPPATITLLRELHARQTSDIGILVTHEPNILLLSKRCQPPNAVTQVSYGSWFRWDHDPQSGLWIFKE